MDLEADAIGATCPAASSCAITARVLPPAMTSRQAIGEHSDDDRRPRTHLVPPMAWLARPGHAPHTHGACRRADRRRRPTAVRDLGAGGDGGLERRGARLPPDHLAG